MSNVDLNDLDPDNNKSILDLKISWRYFKANAKTFIGFIFAGYGISIIFGMLLGILMARILGTTSGSISLEELQNSSLFYLAILIPLLIVLFAYFGSVFGLAYDLLSSGEEYTHFSGSFYYFKRYGWQYVLIETIKSAPFFIFAAISYPGNTGYISPTEGSLWKIIIYLLIGYVWFVIFIMTVPSVTAHGSIKRALKENFLILKHKKKQILQTFGLFFLIFQVPSYLLALLQPYFIDSSMSLPAYITLSLVYGIISMLWGAITNPMAALVSTRIYNLSRLEVKKIREMHKDITGKEEGEENRIGVNREF